jgi:hypothetical protein
MIDDVGEDTEDDENHSNNEWKCCEFFFSKVSIFPT